MKHAGKARRAGMRIQFIALAFLVLVGGAIFLAAMSPVLKLAGWVFVGIWLLFALFVLNFFRDPDPTCASDPKTIVSPGHGTVDVIDETEQMEFMGGRCKRISIFLSVFDVHVQNAPTSGRVAHLKHCSGKFLNAMRVDCGMHNENVLVGIESSDRPGAKVAFRLIAGLLARRIVPWVAEGEVVCKGERTSLIQFGSRVDLYLPLEVRIDVQLGSKVKGGETVVARWS